MKAMELDRLELLKMISFIKSAIPKSPETERNCLFVRVDDSKLIFTGGGGFVTKKVTMLRPNTVEEAANPLKNNNTFMIPRADFFAFKKLMEEHKADCKKLAKDDARYLFVEISDTELISHGVKIVYEQPDFKFKDLELDFQVEQAPVSEIEMISADLISALSDFDKSIPIKITFSGQQTPVLIQQEDYEASVLPPVEKEEGNDQGHGDDQSTID